MGRGPNRKVLILLYTKKDCLENNKAEQREEGGHSAHKVDFNFLTSRKKRKHPIDALVATTEMVLWFRSPIDVRIVI